MEKLVYLTNKGIAPMNMGDISCPADILIDISDYKHGATQLCLPGSE